jgi:deoxyribodipyrimidine photo-lyase
MEGVTIFWFRRDLRLDDNRGLYEALKASERVLPLFIFDEDILHPLPVNDHRVQFIYDTVQNLHKDLQKNGSDLLVKHGKPFNIISNLTEQFAIDAVYCNDDHEPYGMKRDEKVKALLDSRGIPFHRFVDHLVFDKTEVLKSDGSPYVVFTPYSRRWKEVLTDKHLRYYATEKYSGHYYKYPQPPDFPTLSELNFKASDMSYPDIKIDEALIRRYEQTRDFPYLEGTSRLGVHLRFGTVSIRSLVKKAVQWNDTFLNELIWREFYAVILWMFPHVVNQSFKAAYDRIAWRNDEQDFDRWKAGLTGYPMVDAGMRQLNKIGYMHNRLRMVTASFLTKHLLIDWRWGESYFAEKLYDYELSSNNGGWQWSAGTGCDAAPYFRIFNPKEQQKKFDPDGIFVSQWIPELHTDEYPQPIVDHKTARERCLTTYKQALG